MDSGPTGQALRLVSILFVDIVGSTALATQLDPEQVLEVIDEVLARGTAEVQAHGGKVLQYAGDSLLAVFGAAESREDDAERCVRCALALLAQSQPISARVRRRYRFEGFALRAGVHTGRVLLGGGVDGEAAIHGVAVHVAARIEHSAEPGTLRISHDTLQFVRGLFELRPLPPERFKGLAEPLATYQVLGAVARPGMAAQRGVAGRAAPMVGRAGELEQLALAARAVQTDGRLRFVRIVGDAGIGKSRLVQAFSTLGLAEPSALLQGRGLINLQGQPYAVLRESLLALLGPAADGEAAQVLAAIERRLGAMPAELTGGAAQCTVHAHALAHLLGLDTRGSTQLGGLGDDARQLRDRGWQAAVLLLRAMADAAGTALHWVVEDLHWADDASIDFLLHLSRAERSLPLFVLTAQRPELLERRPDVARLCDEAMGDRSLVLQALDAEQASDLTAALLSPLGEVPARLRELLLRRAEGNPFFLEEMVQMLIDRGVIGIGPQGWSFHDAAWREDAVPLTLEGVLQARLDQLSADERTALQDASVIGAEFLEPTLQAVSAAAAEQLPALARRELTRELRREVQAEPLPEGVPAGMRQHAFKHALLHQVTYGSVLQRRRRELHARVARWLGAQPALAGVTSPALIATHHEAAGEWRAAAEHWCLAAEQASERLASATALGHARRGLSLLDEAADAAEPGDHPPVDAATLRLRWRLLQAVWQACDFFADAAGAQAAAAAMSELAETLDDDAARAKVLMYRQTAAAAAAQWTQAEQLALQAQALAERAGDDALRLQAVQRRMLALRRLRGNPEARRIGEQALAESRALGLRGIEQMLANTLGNVYEELGDGVLGQRLKRESLRLAHELGKLRSAALVLGNLGNSERLLGQLEEARRDLEEAIGLMRVSGDRYMLCNPLASLAFVRLQQGDAVHALTLAQESVALALAIGDAERSMMCQLPMGQALLELDRFDEAERAFRTCHDASRALDDTTWIDAAAGLARLALRRGDAAQALAWVESIDAEIAAHGLDSGTEDRLIELSCFEVLRHHGDPRARVWLERAWKALSEQLARLPDEAARRAFLEQPREHRALVQAWHELGPAPAGS